MSSGRKKRILALCASAALFGSVQYSRAASRFWHNFAGGSFDLNTNWAGDVTPTSADVVLFDSFPAETYTVSFPSVTTTTDRLVVGRHNVTFNLLGHTYNLLGTTVPPDTPAFAVGELNFDNASLTITNGTLSDLHSVIGKEGGSIGHVTVSGSTARWDSGGLRIGDDGQGDLLITNFATVNSTSAVLGNDTTGVGTATVNGSSQWNLSAQLLIGSLSLTTGIGNLNIQGGGVVHAQSATIRNGSITAQQFGSRLILDNFLSISPGTTFTLGTGAGIGGGRLDAFDANIRGVANINDRGQFRSQGLTVDGGQFNARAGSYVLIDPNTNSATGVNMTVGEHGPATVSIMNGGDVVSEYDVYLGLASDGNGTVTVSGAGSTCITGNFSAGQSGSGTINVNHGGLLENGNAYMARNAGSASQVNVSENGATWNTNGSLYVGGNESAPGGHAVLQAGGPSIDGFVHVRDMIKVWNDGHIIMERADVVTPRMDIVGGSVDQGLLAPLHISTLGTPDFFGYGTYVGMNGGVGILNISGGGDLSSRNGVLMGSGVGAVGTATISGPGSTWTLSSGSTFYLGLDGSGSVSISGGGSLTSGDSTILGYNPGSDGNLEITGAGSSFDGSTWIDVGYHGKGAMNILNGGLAVGSIAEVGLYADGKATVKIVGGTSEFQLQAIFVGGGIFAAGGPGIVDVEDTGFLNLLTEATVYPQGTLINYGGTIATSELRLRGGMFSAYGSFAPPVSNGGGTVDVPAARTLTLNGTLTSMAGAVLERTGSGTLAINGPQSHAAGAVLRAHGGTTNLNTNAGTAATASAAASANLSVIVGPEAANITLGARQVLRSLEVDGANPGRQSLDLHSPSAPGAFNSISLYDWNRAVLWGEIMRANRAGAVDAQDGIFDSGRASHPSSGVGMAKLVDAHGESYLLIRSTRIGDLNLDGTVTIADFIALSSHFNQSGPDITWQEGDVNYDGGVTIADFIALSSNFNQSYAGDAGGISGGDLAMLNEFAEAHGVSAVPEPAGFFLLGLGAVVMKRRRR